MNIKNILLILIVLIGLNLRYESYKTVHPDQDELFQLNSIKDTSLSRILDNTQFYGDHTSFPGEFLIYNLPLRLLDKDISIDVGNMSVKGMTINDFWKLAIPKIAITLLGFMCLFYILKDCRYAAVGMAIYAFNFQLVYHGIELRPL